MAERWDGRPGGFDVAAMAARVRDHDWAGGPLGPLEGWPAVLRTSVANMLAAGFASFITWGPDLTLLYNDAYGEILGPRHPSALGRPFREVWSEVWDSIADLHRRTMVDGETHMKTDLPLVLRRDGRMAEVWFTYSYAPIRDEDGAIGGLVCLAVETTGTVLANRERDRALEELRRLNETLEQQVQQRAAELRLFNDIVQSDGSPILAFDHGHRVVAFNRAHDDDFLRVMGRRQAIGEVLPDLFPDEQAAMLRGLMDRALAGERFVFVHQFGDPAREVPTWEITYTPLRDAAGRVTGAFHHARDISERLRAEAALAAAEDALRQSQKMEMVGQLTGGVAHDFNNLLTVIRSSVDLLKRPNIAEERRARYIGAISDTVDRAAKITGQLLAFARRQALKPEVFDACESVRALSDMVGTLTGSRIRIETELPGAASYVDADPSQFDTALVNLAVNARDAMDGEGTITIAVRALEAIPPIRGHAGVDGLWIAISVGDTGAGIPPDTIGLIFQPFFTTKQVGKGTGLGLSQVFGFVKQSGGDVDVSSDVGRGTTVTLYLPRVAAPSKVRPVEEPEALADGDGLRVLVVEDNADVGTFAVQSLNDLGYTTVLAADAAAALTELAEDAARFDVVFSDVMMPGMDGVELGQEIRRLYHDLPVVLTSGYSHVLAQNGAHGFELLHKPYSIEQLSQILRKTAAWKRRRRLLGA